MIVALPRVCFDSNSGDMAEGEWVAYWPGTKETNVDLAAIGSSLQDGLRVVLYMSDLEVEAVLEFDRDRNFWIGHPVWTTIRQIVG